MRRLKDDIHRHLAQRQPFLDELVAAGVTLISSSESSGSAVSEAEAASFLAAGQEAPPTAPSTMTEDAEELLDEL